MVGFCVCAIIPFKMTRRKSLKHSLLNFSGANYRNLDSGCRDCMVLIMHVIFATNNYGTPTLVATVLASRTWSGLSLPLESKHSANFWLENLNDIVWCGLIAIPTGRTAKMQRSKITHGRCIIELFTEARLSKQNVNNLIGMFPLVNALPMPFVVHCQRCIGPVFVSSLFYCIFAPFLLNSCPNNICFSLKKTVSGYFCLRHIISCVFLLWFRSLFSLVGQLQRSNNHCDTGNE